MKKPIIMLFVLALLLTGCSSGKAITGKAYYFEYDDQYYYNKSNAATPIMAASDDGYYFFGGPQHMYLYYMDKAAMKPVLLCNKPDCLHTNETDPIKIKMCNAFFLNTNCNMIYYNSSLYIFDAASGSLYQVSLDATKRKKIFSFKDSVYNMIIHRGYAYYVVNDSADLSSSSSKSRVFRVNLDDTGKAPELVFDCNGIQPMSIGLLGYGDSVYYKCSYYEDSKMTSKQNVIYRYDTLRNNCTKLLDNAAKYAFYNETILFCDSNLQMYTCKLDGTKIEKMEGVSGSPFGADENYIFLYAQDGEQRKLLIYDWDGSVIKSIDLPRHSILYGGDNRYFFIYEMGSNEYGDISRILVIDKNKLADGSATLENIYSFEPNVEFPGVITGN